MSSSRAWIVIAKKHARKVIARAPRYEQGRLREALKAMELNPFVGDVVRLTDQPAAFRRRIGDWRILFDVDPAQRLVEVRFVERRSTTTYRRQR